MLVVVAPDPLGVWVEANSAGHAIVFAFEVAGTCGKGTSPEAALDDLRRDLAWTDRWLARHGAEATGTCRLTVVQTVPATGDPLHGDTEGFKVHRWVPGAKAVSGRAPGQLMFAGARCA